MKNINLFILASIFLLFFSSMSCQRVENVRHEGIEGEILRISKTYNQAWESLNTDSVSKYHADDIVYYWHGSKGPTSKVEFENLLNQLLPSMSSYKHRMVDPQIQVLSNDAAIMSHEVDGEYTGKDGRITNYDGALTYVFHRKHGEWKIVLIHESSK